MIAIKDVLIRSSMKRYVIMFALLLTPLFVPGIVSADVYIRAGATGTGTDWSNARPSLPTTLTRSETYWVAGGEYSSYNVYTTSGTGVVTIRKATVAAHGTSTGWNASYAGQAIFTAPFSVSASDVVFEGVSGFGSDYTSYGFRIIPSSCRDASLLLQLPDQGLSGSTSINLSNITIAHVAMTNCGNSYDYSQQGIYSLPASADNITIANNYLANSQANMLIVNWSNSTITDNFFYANWSSSNFHGEQISPRGTNNITLKNNYFVDSYVFVVGFHDCPTCTEVGNTGWNIYNNIILNSDVSSGVFSSLTSPYDCFRSSRVHHNTFINLQAGAHGAVWPGHVTNPANRTYVYNNLFYNSNNPSLDNADGTSGVLVHSHNAHFNSTGTYDSSEGGTAQVATGNPFIGSATGNARLRAHTTAGRTDLGSPYNVDQDNRTRTFWDRGAFEYNSGVPAKAHINSISVKRK